MYVTRHTASSLYYHGNDVQEFLPFYNSLYDSILVAYSTILMIAGVWKRKEWQPFELFLWLMGVAILTAAIRGVALYVLICVGIFARSFASTAGSAASLAKDSGAGRGYCLFRVFCAMMTLCICGSLFYARWVYPQRILGGTQAGIGLALGVWPHQAIRFLKQNPPSGRMINLTWYSGNPLILELYPEHRVFVEPGLSRVHANFFSRLLGAQKWRGAAGIDFAVST